MTTFYDALTGEKRKLNLRERTPTPVVGGVICDGALDPAWHRWDDAEDDTCKCNRCGATVLFVNARKNIHKKGVQ